MPTLFNIHVAINTITVAVPEGQTPGLHRYQLHDDTGLINQQDIPATHVTFTDLPAGYYFLIVHRLDTNGRELGVVHSKGIMLDESAERTYEAIASIEVAGYRQS